MRELTANNSARARMKARPSIFTALAAFDARLPRRGRVERQVRRCLVAHDGIASMTDLRAWCYLGQPCQRWQYWSIKRALRRLGARKIGRAGRAGIWALDPQSMQHACNMK